MYFFSYIARAICISTQLSFCFFWFKGFRKGNTFLFLIFQ